MGYRRMQLQDIRTIYRRWKAGQSIRSIEAAEGITRKTIRKYIQLFQENDWERCSPTDSQFAKLISPSERTNRTKDELSPHLEELKTYITGDKEKSIEPMKAKTAFLVLQEKYDLTISYESFKLFVRRQDLKRTVKSTIRIETEPGEEIQIDYGKVGTLYDPETGRNRVVQAFGGILSHSRHLFVQFVFTMNQESFIQSHIDMFKYFGGISQYLTIDNLKTGILKPDIYDPVINKAYAQMAEHYETFINPCKVKDPKGKAKIERSVPVIREQFRRLKALNPAATLSQLNKSILDICQNDLGMREHGTTGERPYFMFQNKERGALTPLKEPFQIPHWKEVTVGLDQFFQFERKFFALPVKYIRTKVWVCRVKKQIKVFYNNELIRQYVLDGQSKYFYREDFPEGLNAIVEGSYAQWIIRKASEYGDEAKKLIEQTLQPTASLNARRARGLLTVMEKNHGRTDFQQKCCSALEKRITSPTIFKRHLDSPDEEAIPLKTLSTMGQKMARNIEYYTK